LGIANAGKKTKERASSPGPNISLKKRACRGITRDAVNKKKAGGEIFCRHGRLKRCINRGSKRKAAEEGGKGPLLKSTGGRHTTGVRNFAQNQLAERGKTLMQSPLDKLVGMNGSYTGKIRRG